MPFCRLPLPGVSCLPSGQLGKAHFHILSRTGLSNDKKHLTHTRPHTWTVFNTTGAAVRFGLSVVECPFQF